MREIEAMADDDPDEIRPALRPRAMCELPPGRKVLDPYWWHGDDIAPGTLLRHREECRQRRERVAQKRKYGTWDDARQRKVRSLVRWRWEFSPEELWTPSRSVH